MKDWNWFFSSLSQSTAAIVGLFGAFVFTKIINNEQKFNQNKEKIQELILYSNHLKRKLTDRRFNWYNERMRELAIEEMEESIDKNAKLLLSSLDELRNEFNFSPFDNPQNIEKEINALLDKYEKEDK